MAGISEIDNGQLAKLLADLGDSAHQVATTLQQRGIKGVRNTARFLNPLVRYAQDCLAVERFRVDILPKVGRSPAASSGAAVS
jgi:hypothetical protein